MSEVSIDESLIETLLYEEESAVLDFKRDQYRFSGASDAEKAELLKDVLAFSNAWRRTDAFILIGIDERKGSTHGLIGVSCHLADNDLQQFINTKTQKPIEFRYRAITFKGVQIGIIHIPVQNRPIYLRNDFGKLKKHAVYLRRGSSTDIADPDEIAKMGEASVVVKPPRLELDFSFADISTGNLAGKTSRVKVISLKIPRDDEIPKYGYYSHGILSMPMSGANHEFFKELAHYLQTHAKYARLRFGVQNLSSVVGSDVKIEIEVPKHGDTIYFAEAAQLPEEPKRMFFERAIQPGFSMPDRDVQVADFAGHYCITISLGKVQPKSKAYARDELYIGATVESLVGLKARIFADNLEDPICTKLEVFVEVENAELDLKKLILEAGDDN